MIAARKLTRDFSLALHSSGNRLTYDFALIQGRRRNRPRLNTSGNSHLLTARTKRDPVCHVALEVHVNQSSSARGCQARKERPGYAGLYDAVGASEANSSTTTDVILDNALASDSKSAPGTMTVKGRIAICS